MVQKMDVPAEKILIVRNGIDTQKFSWITVSPTSVKAKTKKKKVIAIIGRLTGPKGEICYRLLKNYLDLDKYHVKVVSATLPEKRFEEFFHKAEFTGYVEDIPSLIKSVDLIIGAGRVAMESLLCGRPTFAIGEAFAIGEVTLKNLNFALETNFGDIGPKDLDIDFSKISKQIETLTKQKHCRKEVSEEIRRRFHLDTVVSHIEEIYQDTIVFRLKREVPVLMYHRFIEKKSQAGKHGVYLDIKILEKHFKLLKRLGFETITFSDMQTKGWATRLAQGKRYTIITVDDGYQDNLYLLLPLLNKYNFKAVVYAVSGETFNRWDVETDDPEKKVLLMNKKELQTFYDSNCIELGGHTLTHPHLPLLSAKEQEKEIKANKKDLEKITKKPLVSFAYPYGDLNNETKKLVQEAGYFCAVATNSGSAAIHKDIFQIRRIAIFPKTGVFAFWRKIRGNYIFRKSKI